MKPRECVVETTQLFPQLKYLVLFLEHAWVQVQSWRAGERGRELWPDIKLQTELFQ